jgi:hypothetical protein
LIWINLHLGDKAIPAGLKIQAVQNRTQKWVFEALRQIQEMFPFPLLGIGFDNAGEFINHQPFKYCQTEKITFTRSRPSQKNDNCSVGQKNWIIVRKAVGYTSETEEGLLLLNQLYTVLRLYTNFFQPVTISMMYRIRFTMIFR